MRQALAAGVNDLGGTLMNESISRAAGSEWGQELPPEQMEAVIRSAGRIPRQRTTIYGTPPEEQVRRSFGAEPLSEPLNPPVREAGLEASRAPVPAGCPAGHALGSDAQRFVRRIRSGSVNAPGEERQPRPRERLPHRRRCLGPVDTLPWPTRRCSGS